MINLKEPSIFFDGPWSNLTSPLNSSFREITTTHHQNISFDISRRNQIAPSVADEKSPEAFNVSGDDVVYLTPEVLVQIVFLYCVVDKRT